MRLNLNQQTHLQAGGLASGLKPKQMSVYLFIFLQQYLTYIYIIFYDSPMLVPDFSLAYQLLVSIVSTKT